MTGGVAGLSCYTANLAAYLAGEVADVTAHIAGSVRVAVRTDAPVPAFSHHSPALDLLSDGSRLRYAGADTLAGLAAEVERHHKALAVADTFGLPWSVGRGVRSAPHWILLTGRDAAGWQVVDTFSGLLPDGAQEPFEGVLTDAELAAALELRAGAGDRDRYALGARLELPATGRFWWLARVAGDVPTLPGRWLDGVAAVEFLTEWFSSRGVAAEPCLDDLWAAAQHHLYRFRWLADTAAVAVPDAERAAEAWRSLPRALRFAIGSARRGRPRDTIIRRGFAEILPWLDTGRPL